MCQTIGEVTIAAGILLAIVSVAAIIADYCVAVKDRKNSLHQDIAMRKVGTQIYYMAPRFSDNSNAVILLQAFGKALQQEGFISCSSIDRIYESEIKELNKEKANA